jgi:cation diffusion facilitator family transporter
MGYLVGWISVVVNLFLFGLKYWIGVSADSISMKADAWHTLSDTLTSLAVIVGFLMMAKPPDERHPFGHGRSENIAAVVISVLLAVVAVDFMRGSVYRLVTKRAATFSPIGIAVFGASVVIKEGLAQLAFWAGRRMESKALKADGWHHRSDAAASLLIVLGGFFGGSLWWLDGALGIVVSLLILYAAVEVFRSSASILLGEAPDRRMRKAVVEGIREECPEVEDIHHIHIHRYGDRYELTVHIRLHPELNVDQSHEISDRIERRLHQQMEMETTVHIEPSTN